MASPPVSYLDQQIQNEAANRAAGAPVTRGSFTDIANREVGSGFVDRALGTIPANTPPPAPAFQQPFLSGLLAQLQSATPEQQQQVVSRFAPQIQGLLGPVLQQQEDGRDPDDPEQIGVDYAGMLPADFAKGFAQEKAIADSKWNDPYRLAAGLVPGGGAAGAGVGWLARNLGVPGYEQAYRDKVLSHGGNKSASIALEKSLYDAGLPQSYLSNLLGQESIVRNDPINPSGTSAPVTVPNLPVTSAPVLSLKPFDNKSIRAYYNNNDTQDLDQYNLEKLGIGPGDPGY